MLRWQSMYMTTFKISRSFYGQSIRDEKKSKETGIEEPSFMAFWTVFITNWIAGLLKTNPKSLSGWETPGSMSFIAVEIPGLHALHPAIPVAAKTLIIPELPKAKTLLSIRAFMEKEMG